MITRSLRRKRWQEDRDTVMAQGLNQPLLHVKLQEFPSQEWQSLEVGKGKEIPSASLHLHKEHSPPTPQHWSKESESELLLSRSIR